LKSEVDTVEIAQKQRHLFLLEKINANRPLSRLELEELAKLEKQQKEKKGKSKKSGGRNKKHTIADSQILKTQTEAAEYAGVDTRTIRRWKKEGLPITDDGYYIKGMLDIFKKNKGQQISEDRQKQESAETDLKETKAKLLKIELKIKQGQLIDIAEIEKGRVGRIQAVKQALLGQGRRIAKQLAAIKEPRKIQMIIDGENKIIIRRFAGQMTEE